MLRLHTTESRRPAACFATPTQGKTNGRPYERSSRKQRIEPLKTQIPNLSTAKVVKSSKEAKHKGRRVEALPCAETSSPAQMIERKEQPPARNRESRQTTTTAESGGGGLVSVFAPPYGEDAPPAFHRYENAKTWTRGAYHRNERGKTWTRERGQSLNAARRMVGAGRVFCPPRVQYSPPARKSETDGRRAFSFGRVLDELAKYRNPIDYAEIKRHLPPFSGVFGVFLAAFWPYSGKEPKNAAEQQKPPAASANSQTRNAPRCFCCGDTRGGSSIWTKQGRGVCAPFGIVFPTKR